MKKKNERKKKYPSFFLNQQKFDEIFHYSVNENFHFFANFLSKNLILVPFIFYDKRKF